MFCFVWFPQKCKCETGDKPISSLLISNRNSTTHKTENSIFIISLDVSVLSGSTLVYAYEPLHNDDLFWLSNPKQLKFVEQWKKTTTATQNITRYSKWYIFSGWFRCSETIHKFTIQIRSETSSYSETCMELLNLKVLQILWFITQILV